MLKRTTQLSLAISLCLSPLALAAQDQEASADLVLEEILVTASKREEMESKLPLAISVVSAQDLEDRTVVEMEDAINNIPNVTVEANVSANPRISIRGVSSDTNNIGIEAGVGMQVDGIVLGRPSYFNTALIDVERLEVLRGPQGTLYGKNTTGGLINVVTGRPTQEFEAAGDLTFGSYDLWQVRGHVSGAISDGVSARLAFTALDQDGWAEDRNPANADLQSADFSGARAHVQFDPQDDLRILLTAFYSKDKGIQNFQDIISGPLAALDGNDAYDRSIYNNEKNHFDREISGISATVDWGLDSLTLSSVTGLLENEWSGFNDQDYSELDILATGTDQEQDQFTQEFRITSNDDQAFSWIAGLFYLDQDNSGTNRATLGETTPPLIGAPYIPGYQEAANTISAIETESYAAFVSGTWQFNDAWSLSGGIRYTKEDKGMDYEQTLELFEIAPGVPLGIIAAFAQPVAPTHQTLSDNKPSGDIALSFAPSDDLNFYGRIANGFKAGGFDSTTSATADPGDLRFDPETINSFEIGAKTFLADRRVRLNAAAFYLDWEDKQEQFFNGANFITSNAASASNLGFELEFEALLTTDLTLSGALGHQDAEYDDFVDSATGVDNSGNALPYSPDWTGSLALDYNHTLAGGWALAMRAEALYNDQAYSDSSNDERWASDAYTRFDARIGMNSPSGRFGVSLWGKNLTEEDYFLGGFEFFGTAYASINAPRTFGIEFRASL
jgi:iron complex outermembrane receptor protein